MRYFSMFSGIGGFELGIKQVVPGAKCIGFSEIDKWALSIYKRHFKEHKHYGDANKINPGEIPDFDVLVGGFPCQAFSIAGNRKGFDDTRGTLFFEIARLLEAKRPKLFVLENVKGLLSHNKGATFKTIIITLDELGYDVEWQVLNSKYFTVPQNRERVFIIGRLRASRQSAKQIFPFRKKPSKTIGVSEQKDISADGTRPGTYIGETQLTRKVVCYNAERGLRDRPRNGILSREDDISYALTKTHANHPVQLIGGSQGNRVYDPMGIAVTQAALSGGMGAKTGLYAVPVLTPDRANKRQNGRRFKTDGEPSFTLTAQDKHGVLTDARIRRLMPIECERLQGFPDNWTKYGADDETISDTQRYKCCGNAVTVNVVEAIFLPLIKYLF